MFCFVFFYILFSPYKNYKYFVSLFIFIQNNKLYKSSETYQNNSAVKMEALKKISPLRTGKKKHSMSLPGPQTPMYIQIAQCLINTLHILTLCECKNIILAVTSAREARNPVAITGGFNTEWIFPSNDEMTRSATVNQVIFRFACNSESTSAFSQCAAVDVRGLKG